MSEHDEARSQALDLLLDRGANVVAADDSSQSPGRSDRL